MKTILKPYALLLLFFLSIYSSSLRAQEISLENEKQKIAQLQGAQKVNAANQLAKKIASTQPEEAEEIASDAQKDAQKLDYLYGEAEALTTLGELMAYSLQRPDKAAKYHEEAFMIYRQLYEADNLSREAIQAFLSKRALPTYQYVNQNYANDRRQRKALKNYKSLEVAFNQYLSKILELTKEELQETSSDLKQKKTQLTQKDVALRRQKFAEKQLIIEKLRVEGNLQEKEMEAIALSDSLMKQEIEAQSHKVELLKQEAQAAKLEKENEHHQAEVEKQRLLNNTLLLGIGLGLVLMLLILLGWMKVQKANRQLEEQKSELSLKNEEIKHQKEEIETQRDNLSGLHQTVKSQRDESDSLLKNIFPVEVVAELKGTGKVTPKHYDMATVLFTDFKGFTKISEKLSPEQIVEELNYCFQHFDEIIDRNNLEKIKTIGDAYMCAGGLPLPNLSNPIDAVKAGLEMQEFMERFKADKIAKGQPVWELRIGIHTGPVVAGVIGKNKFAYDIWGDTVNLAARMESSGEVGKVNISADTYELVKAHFNCSPRGRVAAKNKGEVEMFFVEKKSSLFQGIRNLQQRSESSQSKVVA